MQLEYKTRDAKGNDFVKTVDIKEYPIVENEYICPICKKEQNKGCKLKDIVSSNFTDFAFVGDYICPRCTRLFSLYFYSYIEDDDGIRLLNVRQLREELCRRQRPPFRFIITTSQKKHLFYRAKINRDSEHFAVNLETETIYTTPERMKFLFDFVENLLVLGASKKAMQNGEIPFQILEKTGFEVLEILNEELKRSREIQIPLFCGQKSNIREEDALCNLGLLPRMRKGQKQH